MDFVVRPMSLPNKTFYSFCFICFGNICRSPALASVFKTLADKRGVSDQYYIDSMALTTYYLGRPADPRMRHAAEKRGISIDHIAQLFKPSDFQRFDIVFVVSEEAADFLKGMASSQDELKKIMLATAYSKNYKNQDMPDPYYDKERAFDFIMDMAMDSCEGILDHFQSMHSSR